MTEPKRCCDACEYTHYQTDEFDRGVGLITECRNSKCECHVPVSDYERVSHTHCWNNQPSPCGIPIEKHTQCCLCDLKVPVSEPENIPPNCGCECHKKFTYKSHGNCCFILKPLPTPTPSTDNRPEAVLDRILTKVGVIPTPPPTGNYFQYRADPNEKKLEFDAPPTEGTIQRLRELVGNDIVLGAHVESAVLMLLAEQKARMVEEVEAQKATQGYEQCDCSITGKHDYCHTSSVGAWNKAIEKCLSIIKALSK